MSKQSYSYPTVSVVKRAATNTRGAKWAATYYRDGIAYRATSEYDAGDGHSDYRPLIVAARLAIAKYETAHGVRADWPDVTPIVGYVDSANGGGYVLTYPPATDAGCLESRA